MSSYFKEMKPPTLGFKNVSLMLMGGAAVFYLYQQNKAVYRITRLINGVEQQVNVSKRLVTWKEAVEISKHDKLTPTIKFNLHFQLGTHYLETNQLQLAEETFKEALECLPMGINLHNLPPNSRMRVSVVLDNLAQFCQNRGEYQQAMQFYDRALDALVTPQEVATMLASKTRSDSISVKHVESLAGILNNMSMLFLELGKEEQAKAVMSTSNQCMALIHMTLTDSHPSSSSSSSTQDK